MQQPVTLITGASRGLGAELARFLAGQDHHLILTARGEDDLRALAAGLEARGARVDALAGDVADPAHRRLVAEAVGGAGRLDHLIHNASTLGPSPMPELAEMPLEALRQIFEVNTLAPLALTQDLLPWLESASGLVVHLTSDAATGGYAGWGGYGASKAALELIGATLAGELRDRGIASVTVDPGDMRTDMHQAAFPGEDISDRPLPEVTLPFWAWLLGQVPAEISGERYQAQSDRWLVPA